MLSIPAEQLVANLPETERRSAREKFERVQHGLQSEAHREKKRKEKKVIECHRVIR